MGRKLLLIRAAHSIRDGFELGLHGVQHRFATRAELRELIRVLPENR